MDLISIALILVSLWIGVLALVLAICKASGRADADDERCLGEERDDVSTRQPALVGTHRDRP